MATAILRGRTRLALALPLGVFVAASAVLITTVALSGYDPFAAGTWSRWDSSHYLSIAANGYDLEPCSTDPSDWCGNAGWLPTYPLVIALLAAGSISLEIVGLGVSWFFALGVLVLLRRTFLAGLSPVAVVGGLAFAAFVPGVIYHHAVFPLSMFAFATIVSLWLAVKGRWAWAGAAAAVAAATYHLGVLVIPVVVVFAAVSVQGADGRERMRRAALTGGVAALGPLAVGSAMWLQTGRWNAFLLVQDKYGHGFHSPGLVLRDAVTTIADGPVGLDAVPSLQVLFVTLVVTCVAVHVWRRRATATPAEWLLLATTIVLWVVPLTQANAGLYRTAAALVTAAPLVARLPTALMIAVAGCAVALSVPITVLFVDSAIV